MAKKSSKVQIENPRRNPIPTGRDFKKALLIILLATFVSYLPTLKSGFVNLDDDKHVYDNPSIRKLDIPHLQTIFTTTVNKIYTPLTFVTFAVEYHFFKYNPAIYHLNNLLLHLGVTALVFYFALQLGLPLTAAFVAGLLFGIHPMHVESVAWVTERKDVLYAFFYMLALCFYIRYLEERKKNFYLATIVFGLLSILSKPMALSLPLVLLVCDWFKGRRFDKWMVLDKIPYFLYILPIAWLTYSLNARVPGESLHSGIIIWVWTAVFYVWKFFIPLTLMPIYALPEPVALTNPTYLSAIFLLVLLAASLLLWKKHRWVLFAALFYFCSIFFIFRYDDIADRNIVADRFMYLPCVGICFLLGYLIERGLQKDSKKILTGFLICIAVLIGAKTFIQTKIWQNDIALWTHELKYDPQNALAYANRGEAYKELGKFELAMQDFNKSVEADPEYPEGYNSRGQMYGMTGNPEAALKDFEKTLALDPSFDEAYNNIGVVYAMKKDMKKAVENFEKAATLDPANVSAQYNLGDHYYNTGDFQRSFNHFQQVLALDPASAGAYNKRGLIYAVNKDYERSLKDFNHAIMFEPRNSEFYKNRGVLLEHLKMYQEALNDYNRSLAMNPHYADAYYCRGNVYAKTGRYTLAQKDFLQALEINPDHAGARRSQEALVKIVKEQRSKEKANAESP